MTTSHASGFGRRKSYEMLGVKAQCPKELPEPPCVWRNDQSFTHKLTKKPDGMKKIGGLPDWIRCERLNLGS